MIYHTGKDIIREEPGERTGNRISVDSTGHK